MLFVDAIANLRSAPARRRNDYLIPTITAGALPLTDGLTASYQAIYEGQPWVYAGVNKIARSMMRMPLKAYEYGEGRERKQLSRDAELATLIRRPSPYLPWSKLAYMTVRKSIVYGNGILVKFNAQGKPIREEETPAELFPAPSIGWTRGTGDTYIWTSHKGEEFEFQRWQIIHYTFSDRDESGFGLSMLEPLRETLAVENAARRYAVAAFKNGARPGSILKTDQKLKQETADALKAAMQALHGGADNAFKVAVLEQGLDWAPPPAHNLEEAALINHRELTQEEVAAVLDVPQPTMGILRNANFASIDMLHTMLYQDSCGPWAVLIEDTTQADLVEITPAFAGQFVEVDMNGVMRGDLLSRVRAYATMLTSGQKTANEVRALENDPPSDQEDANRLLFPTNLAGAVGAQAAEDSGQEDDQPVTTQNGRASMNGVSR